MEDLDYKDLFRDAIHTIAYIARAAGFDPNDPTVEPPAIIARVENQRAEVERLTAERAAPTLTCRVCGSAATCCGQYEGAPEVEGGCDIHCGHGNEDGWCVPVAGVPALVGRLRADVRRFEEERAALLVPIEVARLRALLGAEQTRAETYNEENREVVSALEDAGQFCAGKDPVAAVRALHADVQRLQEERAKLEALATELFDGVPTSPENALTWLHQEVMRALTTPNWPGVLVEILLERVRQIEKGYNAAHDDKLTAFELSTVAAAVTLGTVEHLPVSGDARELTGHIIEKWDTRRRLVIAAALVVAEIERLDRKQGGRTT